jgi:ABC-type Fe3+/spermidine/putrescine transport system ATPase subunit
MTKITLKNLTKKFDNDLILNHINMEIKSGELVALLGPSGCGKTTTLKIISGLISPSDGDVLFADKSVLDTPVEKRSSVLVFQDYLLFPHLNIAENISFGLKMKGVDKETRLKKASELLSLVDLPGYENYYPHEVSGGQKQRVSLARALAIDPQVLLLDEPLSNLDVNLRGDMQDLILELHSENDMTTIFVTHDHEEAMIMSDKIAIMNNGIIEQYGPGEELYKHPKNKFVADFFGNANYLLGEVKSEGFIYDSFNIPLKNQFNISDIDQINAAMIRPENVEFNKKIKNGINFKAKIKERKFIGERVHYKLSLANNKEIIATVLSENTPPVKDEINIAVDYRNIWFMNI